MHKMALTYLMRWKDTVYLTITECGRIQRGDKYYTRHTDAFLANNKWGNSLYGESVYIGTSGEPHKFGLPPVSRIYELLLT